MLPREHLSCSHRPCSDLSTEKQGCVSFLVDHEQSVWERIIFVGCVICQENVFVMFTHFPLTHRIITELNYHHLRFALFILKNATGFRRAFGGSAVVHVMYGDDGFERIFKTRGKLINRKFKYIFQSSPELRNH